MKILFPALAGAVLALSIGLAPTTQAAPQMVSLVFNSALQGPQQIGADSFRGKLIELAEGRFAVDERGSNTLGSETAVMAAVRTPVSQLPSMMAYGIPV